MAGAVFMNAVRQHNAVLLPVDSEHNAIFQCLPADYQVGKMPSGINRILLSGSGGPFRETSLSDLEFVTPDQACNHPNWDMGRKISVDSATMMNKGLELIEACWLFDVSPDQVQIVIHPQSIVHSLVEYRDGSILAQMGTPDMRIPIAHTLAWPQRIESGAAILDLMSIAKLTFEPPDFNRFPCLKLAVDAARTGDTAPAILNAANEVAVDGFLNGLVGYTDIAYIVEQVLNSVELTEVTTLDVVKNADEQARRSAVQLLEKRAS